MVKRAEYFNNFTKSKYETSSNLDIAYLMKKNRVKGLVTGIIVGGLLFGSVGAVAIGLTAKEIKYTPSNDKFTVTNVQEAIDEIYKIAEYEIPDDTYFYEKGTEGSEDSIVRYKKIDGQYYVCNVNGIVAEGTVATDVTSKTLVEYTGALATSLSAGKAGYASNSFILGNASSNVITIGTYSSNATQQIDCTHILNYDKLTIDNFVYDDISILQASYHQMGDVNNADSYDPNTGIYTIGQKSDQTTTTGAAGVQLQQSHYISFTLKCFP